MKTIKVSEATKIQLDWLVAKLTEAKVTLDTSLPCYPLLVIEGEEDQVDDFYAGYSPSTDWSQGGPIIERERIAVQSPNDKGWYATDYMFKTYESGPTPLIAAMRCYVTSKLGETVEIPKGLL